VRIEHGYNKVDKLHDLLRQPELEKVLLFGRTKWGVQKLTDELIRRGFKAGAIHGNKRQNQRQKTLDAFKGNELQILLATDVASRGLDIPDVSHVINYDMPESYEVYIHRIGRTGRADKKGIALTFIEGV
jgi:ATP-dependent RNA helicase RhlE